MQARIKKLAAHALRRGEFAQKGRGRKRCIGKGRSERQIMQAYESGTGIKNTYPHTPQYVQSMPVFGENCIFDMQYS